MGIITAKIPKNNNNYSIYVEGTLVSQIDCGSYYELEFSKGKILILYYNFKLKHRRLYIVCNPDQMENSYEKFFLGLSDKMSIIAELRGRGFDRFKRSIDYLKKATENQIMSLPPAFWFQMAYICRNGINNRFNLNNLVIRYGLTIKEIEWN